MDGSNQPKILSKFNILYTLIKYPFNYGVPFVSKFIIDRHLVKSGDLRN